MTMTAVTMERTAPGPRAGMRGTLRSELTKVRSVRSTYWSLIVLVLAGVAFSIANCAGTAANWAHEPPGANQGFDPTQASVVGVALLGQLAIVVFGALAITSEYGTGMIRTSLAVMPRRGVLFGAKAIVVGAIAVVVAVPTSFIAFFVGQALLGSTHDTAALSGTNVLRAVLGSALFVVICGMIAFGLGGILRHTAGAITAAYGLLFLVPQLAKALPSQWFADVVRWLPGGDAGAAITTTQRNFNPHLFSAWGELAVFAGYAVVLLALGALFLRRRDA
jgi:ABC-type transport system involved in multi-copper enzyme maturation permease subunit